MDVSEIFMEKKIKNYKILISILLIILLTLIFLIAKISLNITGKTVKDFPERTFTKAICNKTYCQDYEIYCNENETLKVIPISGAIIENIKNEPEIKTNYCN